MKIPRSLDVKKVILRRNIITIGLMVSGIFSVILALLTYYGSYSGNFIVVLDKEVIIHSIVLSEDSDFSDPVPRLFADSVKDSDPIIFFDLKMQEALGVDGNYYDPEFKYLAYSFYLKNNGNQIVDIRSEFLITDVYRGADEAIRVILIEDNQIDNLKMYQKPDRTTGKYSPEMPEAIPFVSDKTIFEHDVLEFAPEQIKRYTIIVYVEGQDPECIDEISSGMIKMTMRFRIIEEDNI